MMLEWNKLSEQLRQDHQYCRLLDECRHAEEAYKALSQTWDEEQRQIVERYLSACEELDHRMLTIALSQDKN